MHDDLLDAQAVIDWAVSDLPILERKITNWCNNRPYRIRGDVDTQPGKKFFRLQDVQLIPDIINAEGGVILHAIRSSLDFLAVALAERNGHTAPEDVYFPVAKSRAAFFAKNGACKKIKRLADADIKTIENLEPWLGGNNLIAEMHYLDIRRKHQRLLGAFASPSHIIVAPKTFAAGSLQFVQNWPGFHDDAIIAIGTPDVPEGDFVISLEIRFAEAGLASTKSVIAMLRDFASAAQAIIALFGTP